MEAVLRALSPPYLSEEEKKESVEKRMRNGAENNAELFERKETPLSPGYWEKAEKYLPLFVKETATKTTNRARSGGFAGFITSSRLSEMVTSVLSKAEDFLGNMMNVRECNNVSGRREEKEKGEVCKAFGSWTSSFARASLVKLCKE